MTYALKKHYALLIMYLDNAATTKTNKNALATFLEVSERLFFNCSSIYAKGGRDILENVRAIIATEIGAVASEIYFTSGGTESNNLAITGGVKNKNKSVVVSSGEHQSVYECARSLVSKGYSVKFSPLESDTGACSDSFIKLATDNCGFVSLMHTSNETGVINNIGDIFTAIKNHDKNIITHSDGVQSFLKTPVDVVSNNIDLYSISGHKIGAPKGIGALYIKKGLHINAQMLGGSQEKNIRAGTENLPAIAALGVAIKEYKKQLNNLQLSTNFAPLRKTFIKELQNGGIDFKINEAINLANQQQNIISLSIKNIRAEVLQRLLIDKHGIYIGLGSACASTKSGNRILQAAGLNKQDIASSIRISFGLQPFEKEVLEIAKLIVSVIKTFK